MIELEVFMFILDLIKEEILKVVLDCEGLKVFRFDGFNFNFIKKMWYIIKEDIVNFVK